MTVVTQNSTYTFSISDGKLHTTWGHLDIVVTTIKDLEVGKRLYISGYKASPDASCTKEIAFRTSPVKEILP